MPLLEKAGRGVRLTDAAVVLVRHAGALLEQADRATAELEAAAAGEVAGRMRVAAFQSAALRVAAPALRALARDAPALRCELVEMEPEAALPALALGDLDLVLGDEWQHQPHARIAGLAARRPPPRPGAARAPRRPSRSRAARARSPLDRLAGAPWVTGHAGTGWDEMVLRTCRGLGGFDPDVRHRANDSVLALGLVADGLAVTLLPRLVAGGRDGVAVRPLAGGDVHRTIFAATRAADERRPAVLAARSAIDAVAAGLGWSTG